MSLPPSDIGCPTPARTSPSLWSSATPFLIRQSVLSRLCTARPDGAAGLLIWAKVPRTGTIRVGKAEIYRLIEQEGPIFETLSFFLVEQGTACGPQVLALPAFSVAGTGCSFLHPELRHSHRPAHNSNRRLRWQPQAAFDTSVLAHDGQR